MGDSVVIVGSGFAAFWAAAAARRVAGEAVRITMVAPAPSLVMRPRLYEAEPQTLSVDLRPLLDSLDVTFVADHATDISATENQLTLASGDTLAFDRLVVATGSVMRRPPVPGADEAYSIDTQSDAIEFDLRLTQVAADSTEPSIAVLGAGFTGVELALELRDRISLHADAGSAAGTAAGTAERLRIVLVDRAAVIAEELGPTPRPVIEEALNEAGVEIRLSAAVTELGPRHMVVDNERLDFDAVVLATGLQASSFAARIPGERDRAGRIMVDETLRAPAATSIFVTGDAATADTGDGHRSLQSCQHALQLGRYAGENAARDILGLPLIPYEQLRYVTCLDLGRSGAVLTQGWDRDIVMTGSEAKALKTSINSEIIYPPEGGVEALLRHSELDPANR